MRNFIASELPLQPDNDFAKVHPFDAVKNGLVDFHGDTPTQKELELIEKYIQNSCSRLDIAAFAAAYFNKAKLLSFFLEHVADINMAICGAVQAGNQSIVDDLIGKNADKNHVLRRAAFSDERKLIDHLLDKHRADIEYAIKGAVDADNPSLDLVDGLIKKGADKNYAVLRAAFFDKRELMDHLLKTHCADINFAMDGAAQANNKSLIIYLQSKPQSRATNPQSFLPAKAPATQP